MMLALAIVGVDVDDIGMGNPLLPEATRVVGIHHLDATTANGSGMTVEEILDVVAIDRSAPIETPAFAQRAAACAGRPS